MKRQFSTTVRNETKKMVIVTGDSLPIDVIVADSSEKQTATFNVMTNHDVDNSRILFEDRSEEIYLTILDCQEGIKGVVKAYIPKENDFIVCHKDITYYFKAEEELLTIRYWKDGERAEIPQYKGKLRRIHIGETVKISFFDRENATFKP